MSWTETRTAFFSARHEGRDAPAARSLLRRLEQLRAELATRFERTPTDTAVVMHPGSAQLALAHPWWPLLRLAAAPAARRYLSGWHAAGEIHVLAPRALDSRASAVPGSREALELSPLREYAHLVVAANNPALPPPFTPASLLRYLRWAWLSEGAAAHLSGQTRHLRGAVVRRLREGPPPAFPPSARDAHLLGGTVFGLVEHTSGPGACVALASRLHPEGPVAALERACRAPAAVIEREWRRYLTAFTRPPAAQGLGLARALPKLT